MIIFGLVGLFIIQLISIFVIVLLYSKITKFKDLEVRQDRLVREMDDAIGMYLLEMREENDRLIQELKSANVKQAFTEKPNQQAKHEATTSINPQTVEALLTETRTVVPKTVAANVYNKHKEHQQYGEQEPTVSPEPKVLPTFEQQVVADYQAGLTVEDIAKKTQRGKTEIELLIKFHA